MREEYDLKKLKVKRRGLLPELKDEKGKPAKVRITISLDRGYCGLLQAVRQRGWLLTLSNPDKPDVAAGY